MTGSEVCMRVAVLMGGNSAEREVSLETGGAVAGSLAELGHEVVQIDTAGDVAAELAAGRPDAAFLALHGRGGEDGTMQGLLEVMRIPYTGSGVLASALTMDKVLTKEILGIHGLPVVEDVVVRRSEAAAADGKLAESGLTYPVMVKPALEGSSIAVTEVGEESGLERALDLVFEIDDTALIERFIDGRLLTVGILGEEPVVLPVLEIRTGDGFYDYRAKYQPGHSEYEVPAALDDVTTRFAQRISLESFRLLGCESVSRVDLMLENGTRRLFILEVNTIPGMTSSSLIPMAAAARGIGFNEVVAKILDGARLKLNLRE